MAAAFDYLVIGGGSGGLATARRAVKYGQRVAIIENKRLGGTCVNVGCVPKKLIWNAACLKEDLEYCAGYGITVGPGAFNWTELKQRRDAEVARLNGIYQSNLEKDQITWVHGLARFVDAHTVEVEGQGLFTAPHITIAVGTYSLVPRGIEGIELAINSDGFFELETQPARVMIIGSGYIATEIAGIFRSLGSEVTLVLGPWPFLEPFDLEVSELLRTTMEANGVKFYAPYETKKIVQLPSGAFHVDYTNGSEGEYDCVMHAIGRVVDGKALNIEAAGLATNRFGYLPVDDFQNSTVPGIYVVGDACGKSMLTPVAVKAGRILADRLFGGQAEAKMDYEYIPTVMFAHPQIGMVGYPEYLAKKKFGDDQVHSYKAKFNAMFYSFTQHKVPTLVKMVCVGPEERVVGLHFLGRGVEEMVQGFAVAVKLGATRADFNRTVAIHPTVGEEVVLL